MPKDLPPIDEPDESPHPIAAAQRFTPAAGADMYAQAPAPGEGGVEIARYWSAVKRYRWLVLLMTVLGIGAGFAGTRVVKPKYLARATIWIQGNSQQLNTGPIRPDELLQSAGWVDLLHSFVVLDEVVKRVRLYVVPERGADTSMLALLTIGDRLRPGRYKLTVDGTGKQFVLATRDGTVLQRGQAGDSIGAAVGLDWMPPATAFHPGESFGFSILMPREAALKLSNELNVNADETGTFLSISLTGTDPVRTVSIVNTVVEREVEVATDLKKAKLTELTRILEEQLATAQSNLSAAENALETFHVKTATLPSDQAMPVAPGLSVTTNPALTSFFNMKVQRENIRADRASIVRILGQVPDSGLSVDAMLMIPAVDSSTELKGVLNELTQKEATLRTLRSHYTDATPAVNRAAQEVDSLERQTIPKLAMQLVADMDTRARDLDLRMSGAAVDLQQIPQRAIEEARLERAVSITANLYTNLQARYEENRLAEASSIPDVRPLDRAMVPQAPVSNTAPKILLMGLVLGLGLGLAGAVLLDQVDKRVRYPTQVTSELGLPILGTLPRVSRNGSASPEEMAHVVESLRSIRLSLTHAHGAAGPLLLTISSPGSGDGKSFLSSNLAIAFADAGYHTLLIDGDLRRGGLHRVLKGTRTPGLTDFLTGAVTRDTIIQATPYPLLSFIGGGTRKQTAPELLGTPAMRELVLGLRSNFQVILIDSSPLGAAVDPFMLSTLTGNLVVVLRTGATDRAMARAKLEMMDRLPVRILGAVLNDVQAEGVYRYYGYLAGYEAEEERDGMRLPAGAGKS
ncbi:MAG TPA: polysaccharide biosynthesis tyrosine autokinase [Gemmatimonadales bacterium]|nr:polysaccharide biosynthesis tyrosine autokinase [Gemmatimonadales bacterium]